ncbi:MAG: M23 family metallopeptidase [Muribaculaceae bacterium]|nr:M23 family metallopeptidase [Muribaculaceae bacterium]
MKSGRILLTTLLATVASIIATAQVPYRLPQTHTDQHHDLIANQKPINISLTSNQEVATQVAEREAAAEVFGVAWNHDGVDPYGKSVEIPATKRIDVSDFHLPVPGALTSPFGWRARFGRMHKGVDLNLKVGDTVRCAFSGIVRLTKYNAGGYGYYVVVRHDNGMETVYGHLSRFLVKPDQRVEAGQPLALGGNTGRSTGPHLHFETRYLGIAINPESIIDFQNRTTHLEYFVFDRQSCERALAQTGSRAKKSGKAIASKSKSKKKKSTATRKRSTKAKRK